MKKLLFVILSLFAVVAYADNTITSKEYVDGQVSNLQTQIPAKNTNTVLTNTGTAGTVGEKAIYDTTAAYGAQTDALVTAGAFNSAVQNALESEFVCVEWQGNVHDNAHCLLYEVRGATQMQTLPVGYTQLEYIESTGTQYIDTGIIPTNTMGLDIKFNKTSYGDLVIMGVLYDSDMKAADLYVNIGTSYRIYLPFGEDWSTANYSVISGIAQDNTDYTVKINYMNDRNRYVNDWPTLNIDKTLTGATDTMYLFAGHSVPEHGPGWLFIGRIYYLKITEGNQLVRNFIPARRNSDNALGMYDTVSGTFFTNAGTGTFTAGPVVSSNLYLPNGN